MNYVFNRESHDLSDWCDIIRRMETILDQTIGGNYTEAELSAYEATYNGQEFKPEVTSVKSGTTALAASDYSVSYPADTSVDAGTYEVTVTGKGNYGGSLAVPYTIHKAKLNKATLSATSYTYNGKTQKPTVKSAQAGDLKLTSSDYTVAYSNDKSVNAGTYKVTVTGKGNFEASKTLSYTITKAKLTDATLSATSYTYTGKPIKPAVTVKSGAKTLKSGTDYTLSYAKNTNVGTAKVTVTGKGNYTGTLTRTFQIKEAPLDVSYCTHVQKTGWQDYKKNGAVSGTTGKSLRLEGFKAKLGTKAYSGGISYRVHVQGTGWQDWRADDAMAGTTGKSLRLEAIDIKLTGELAKHYDVWYRVHAQQIGWMGWTKNGASAGTTGYSWRLEALQVKIVPKGTAAPGSTSTPFRTR